MADALRRAVLVVSLPVIPYFGYARQDRRPRSSRVPNLLQSYSQIC